MTQANLQRNDWHFSRCKCLLQCNRPAASVAIASETPGSWFSPVMDRWRRLLSGGREVPTCSVTSHIHLTINLRAGMMEYGPLSLTAGVVSLFTFHRQQQRARSLFYWAGSWRTHARQERRKKEEPIMAHSNGKPWPKTSSCNTEVTVTHN